MGKWEVSKTIIVDLFFIYFSHTIILGKTLKNVSE